MEVLRVWYRIPFLSSPPLSPVPVPMPSYNPFSTRGVALEEVTLGLIAKGAVELAPLPSPGFYSRLFVMWKTSGSWRPVIDLSHLNRFVDVSHFQMETIQSVLLSVRQGDWMASIDLREAYLQVPVHPESRPFLRFVLKGSRLPVQSSVLWPLHGSAGLLSGHGSCLRHSPCYGYPHAPISRRLASPVLFSGVPSPGSPDSPRALPRVGCGDQPGEIPPRSIPGGAVSRCGDQHPVFCGFSIARSHFQAAVNRRRISILRLASREVMALSAGDAFFAGSPGSWRQTAYAVSPAVPQSLLGSRRPLDSSGLVSGVSSGSPVVAPPASPLPGCVPPSDVSRPRLLVRRLGRQVGCSYGSPRRFRPLGLGTGVSIHQRQGAAGHPARSPPLSVVSARPYSRGLLRQRHCGGVSPQGRRHQISIAEHHSSGDPALVGVSSHPSGSAVHPGLQQRPSGSSVSPSPAASFRVVPQHDRVSVFMSSVAGANRFVCDLRQSPLLDLFFTLLRPSVGGH